MLPTSTAVPPAVKLNCFVPFHISTVPPSTLANLTVRVAFSNVAEMTASPSGVNDPVTAVSSPLVPPEIEGILVHPVNL